MSVFRPNKYLFYNFINFTAVIYGLLHSFFSNKLHEACQNIKQVCWLSKQAVGASKHVICANMKIITIWVSGNNRS